MAAILTSAETRAAERAAMDSGAVTGLELMERAGQGVVDAILAHRPDLAARPPEAPPRATVLCGPGNNGGDGFVVARLLAERGWAVRVLSNADPDRMPPDARAMRDRWAAMGPVLDLTEAVLRDGDDSDLYVDAIFGLGLSRPPEGEVAAILGHMGGANGDFAYYRTRIVAVDAPSGLDLDTGRLVGPLEGDTESALRAALTVTFQTLKPGHLLADGPDLCGRVVVADIGLDPWWRLEAPRLRDGVPHGRLRVHRLASVEPPPAAARGIDRGWLHPVDLDRLPKRQGHKFAHGHALVLAGGPGRGGAARLAARAALSVVAGLVTLAPPPEAIPENAARLDAVMLRPVADAAALADHLADPRLNALGAGPGLGTAPREAALVAALLAAARPTILDADALTLVASSGDLRAALHPGVILTPHGGEFARLAPGLAAPSGGPGPSKLDAAREAAARLGCTLLLKGPDTVVADPSGRAAIHAAAYDRAAPWLATAGSGDVLAGLIAGLLARGLPPFEAACTAAWLHVEAARAFGPGLIAEDLPDEIPTVFRALGL